ncbi:MAG: prepilin-type N-terminal cleavage/methylation domain-containing protein [Deltaproteobacteria bacterium]|nr:prepilin-type N-terminal cleavage/methylation domain-containing protein [Deltaproteobacteria bacterium]
MFSKLAKFLSPSIRQKQGFTLVELLIVVAIMAILAAIAIPQFGSYRRRGYNASANSDLRNIRTTEEAMYADFQEYGTSHTATATYDNTAATVTGATLYLSTPRTSSTPQSIALSPSVIAYVTGLAGATVNTDYAARTGHTSGDVIYAAEAASSALYRRSAPTTGTIAASEVSATTGITVNTATADSYVSPWTQMQ